ncbi:MAG: methanethiol S-methyltransferase [Pseudomonadota bacterium]
MKRFLVLVYGVSSYVVFFATFLYSVGFIGNLIVPKSIDSVPQAPLATALFVNVLLLVVFAVQHSVMARPAFKRWWTQIVPEAAERSTYVLFSSMALILLFALWEPMGGVIWSVSATPAVWAIYALFAFGWGLLLVSTFAIDHFDLFGLRQTWSYFRNKKPQRATFVEPWLYRVVRHPLYVGWFFAIWATPVMTAAHLVFALGTSIYMLIGIQLEERDLADAHPEYHDYKSRVPMLIPRLRALFGRRTAGAIAASKQ